MLAAPITGKRGERELNDEDQQLAHARVMLANVHSRKALPEWLRSQRGEQRSLMPSSTTVIVNDRHRPRRSISTPGSERRRAGNERSALANGCRPLSCASATVHILPKNRSRNARR